MKSTIKRTLCFVAIFLIMWIVPSFVLTKTISNWEQKFVLQAVPKSQWDKVKWDEDRRVHYYTTPLVDPTMGFILSASVVSLTALFSAVIRK